MVSDKFAPDQIMEPEARSEILEIAWPQCSQQPGVYVVHVLEEEHGDKEGGEERNNWYLGLECISIFYNICKTSKKILM